MFFVWDENDYTIELELEIRISRVQVDSQVESCDRSHLDSVSTLSFSRVRVKDSTREFLYPSPVYIFGVQDSLFFL